ncbi:MAG: GTP-binding protein [Pseudomonadota bacterium]
MTRIPVTILTGFLGAGKTTLANRLMTQPGFGDTAVIINEFGEADIDGLLVNHVEDRAFASTTGCLCCTVSGDVRFALLRLLDEADRGVGPMFSRVVIETTGLADPSPILRTFMSTQRMLDRFVINGVVTLVDAVNGANAIDRFEEAQRQVAVADLMILTKSDLAKDTASRRDLVDFKQNLVALNPNARLQNADETTAGDIFSLAKFNLARKPPDVRAWLRFDVSEEQSHADGHAYLHESHDHSHNVNIHGGTAAFCFSAKGPIEPSTLKTAISALQASLGADLLRMKGMIEISDHPNTPYVLQVVGHVASPLRMLDSWPKGIDTTRIVLIVAGLGRRTAPDILVRFLPELSP